MELTTLLKALKTYEVFGPDEAEVTGIVIDSRRVTTGALFAAIRKNGIHIRRKQG